MIDWEQHIYALTEQINELEIQQEEVDNCEEWVLLNKQTTLLEILLDLCQDKLKQTKQTEDHNAT